jgi:hypothetical protein
VIIETIRKSTLALVLVLLTVSAGKTLTHTSPIFPPSQPTPDGSGGANPGGGNPNPTCGDNECLVEIH